MEATQSNHAQEVEVICVVGTGHPEVDTQDTPRIRKALHAEENGQSVMRGISEIDESTAIILEIVETNTQEESLIEGLTFVAVLYHRHLLHYLLAESGHQWHGETICIIVMMIDAEMYMTVGQTRDMEGIHGDHRCRRCLCRCLWVHRLKLPLLY